MFQTKRQKNISSIVFVIYLIFLIWLIVFKFATNIDEIPHMRNINLIPFQGSVFMNGSISMKEIVYNVLVFVPFGLFVSMFHSKLSFVKRIIPGLLLSILFEVIQFAFAIGASDITDVIGNTAGGIIGVLICILLQKILKEKMVKFINVIGLTLEAVFAFFFIILFAANM